MTPLSVGRKTALEAPLSRATRINEAVMCAVKTTCNDHGTIAAWLHRPLCRRYVVAVFGAAALRELRASASSIEWGLGFLSSGECEVIGVWHRHAAADATPMEALGGLRARGVEFISVAVDGRLECALDQIATLFPRALPVESLEQQLRVALGSVAPKHRQAMVDGLWSAAGAAELEAARRELDKLLRIGPGERYPKVVQLWDEALARSKAVVELPAPMKALVRSADRTAAEVSERLAREIQRHGSLDDSDAAFEFVSSALLRAERRLDRAWAAPSAVRQADLLPSPGGESMSTGAVGVPTLA